MPILNEFYMVIFTSKFIFGPHSCIFYLPWILYAPKMWQRGMHMIHSCNKVYNVMYKSMHTTIPIIWCYTQHNSAAALLSSFSPSPSPPRHRRPPPPPPPPPPSSLSEKIFFYFFHSNSIHFYTLNLIGRR